jgi:hypothetical protein
MTPATPEAADDNEPPRVPGFRTWRGVYVFVLVFFVVCVVLLALLAHTFA